MTVWNRTRERAGGLGEGVAVAGTPAAATAASPLVLICVTNFEVVRELLRAIGSEASGRTLVTLTTGSPEEAREAAAQCEQAGAAYLDAGVQAQPETIGTPAATLLFSGPRAAFEEHRATLSLLGTLRHVGERAEGAAVHDLTLFGLWYDAQIALLRAFETVRRAGVDLEAFAPLAATQLRYVLDAVDSTKGELVAGSFPRGPASLTEHAPVVERLVALRRGLRLGDGDLERVRQLLHARIANGREQDGFNSLLADD